MSFVVWDDSTLGAGLLSLWHLPPFVNTWPGTLEAINTLWFVYMLKKILSGIVGPEWKLIVYFLYSDLLRISAIVSTLDNFSFTYACVCVCMYVASIHICVCECLFWSALPWWIFGHHSLPCLRQAFLDIHCCTCQANWPKNFLVFSCLRLPAHFMNTGRTGELYCAWLYVGSGDSSSNNHTCVVCRFPQGWMWKSFPVLVWSKCWYILLTSPCESVFLYVKIQRLWIHLWAQDRWVRDRVKAKNLSESFF